MTEKGEKGVIYISADDSYLDEAIRSVESLKEHNSEVQATLYTDEENLECEVFDQIITVDYTIDSMDDSMIKPFMTPYEKNLYLDTDTYVTGNISELFEILENYDIAACHAPNRERIMDTPECFGEYNTGVIAYRGSREVKNVLQNWHENYDKVRESDVGKNRDQHPFARTIFESDIDFFTLPPEYNMRLPRCGYAKGEVKILHGRPRTSMEKVDKALNKTEEPRIHYATQDLIGSGRAVKTFSTSYAIQKGLKVLLTQGPRTLIKKIQQHIRKR
jgi:hypothetical protein